MKKQDSWKIMAIVVILAITFFLVIILSLKNKNEEINSFEACAAAGYPVGESYPRQCWTNGGHFVEEITWKNDQIFLMQILETGNYACFGCSVSAKANRCVDPALNIMKPANETIDRHCNQEFEIVSS